MSETTYNIPRDTTLQELVEIQKANNKALNTIAVAQAAGMGANTTWAGVAQLVRQGMGPNAYPVGSQLTATHSKYTNIVWDVVHHDTANKKMYLLSHYAIEYGKMFDNTEALYYCEAALPAGTYHFTIPDYDATYGGNKTYQFTTTQQVPAKGQVVLTWSYNQQVTAGNIKTYASADSTTALDTCTLTEGTGGTDLGTADGNSTNMNHIHRARYGSNNWKESNIRAWLNSDLATMTFTAQTKYDRPASYSTGAGFMNGFGADFLAVVAQNENACKTNTVFDLNGTTQAYTTKDYFWLPSVNEVGFSTESGIAEGTKFDFYNGATNADRIKRDTAGTARYWWLRSPSPSSANLVRRVSTDGSLSYSSAYNTSSAVAPACVIG